MRVMVVFDPDYGRRKNPDLGDAFWLVESPCNRALATKVWAAGTTDANSAVVRGGAQVSDDDVLGIIEDVDLHHAAWTEMNVRGVALTVELKDLLRRRGLAASAADGAWVVTR